MADDAQSAADSSAYQQVGTRNPVGCAIFFHDRIASQSLTKTTIGAPELFRLRHRRAAIKERSPAAY